MGSASSPTPPLIFSPLLHRASQPPYPLNPTIKCNAPLLDRRFHTTGAVRLYHFLRHLLRRRSGLVPCYLGIAYDRYEDDRGPYGDDTEYY